ncbi:MAG: rpfG 12 [Bacillales bacterium]|jgi:HD-GYP domain-containing protein (c-di-GMP phosphodiesterase class II)|nr:rpfG 12 [Bacillales bacterium]
MSEILIFNQQTLIIATSFLVLFILIFVLAIVSFNRTKKFNSKVTLMRTVIDNFIPTIGIEKNLDLILIKAYELVEARNYSFYIFNPTNNHFTLKAVRQLTSDGQIAPSYSGLLPYDKENYSPPLSILLNDIPKSASIVKEGEVPLLVIPIKGGKGLIRIGPVSKVKKNIVTQLNYLGELLESPLNNLIDEEEQQRTFEVMKTSAKAVKYINNLFVNETEYIKLLVQTCSRNVNPAASSILVDGKISYSTGISKQNAQGLNISLKDIVGDKPFLIVSNTNPLYKKLKEKIRVSVGNYFAIAQFSILNKQYAILFSFEKSSVDIEQSRQRYIKELLNNIKQLSYFKHRNQPISSAYIELLKAIADMIDNTTPYSVGYSKQMSRYSIAIAKVLKLSESQINSIGLAAYFSNIGVLGLSDGLVMKEGKYSEEEYEQMKLHSEVGAAIIENTIAHNEVANYIRYHHERIDGNGYPSRLKGEEIPIGARIIFVVQTFLAKINGRQYRDPLPFDDALNILRSAAGSQLDTQISYLFNEWFNKRRILRAGQNKALGNCWDLCCTSGVVCSGCPAFRNSTINCWEQSTNNCEAHGKTCKTCFVYTETAARLKNTNRSAI